MNRADEYAQYKKFNALVDSSNTQTDNFDMILRAACHSLAMFTITSSTSENKDEPADVPDVMEVAEMIGYVLQQPPDVFTTEYFAQPFFPVKSIHLFATFYGCGDVDEDFLLEV